MLSFQFPPLPLESWRPTFDTLHGYARALGAIRRALTPRRKHWYHASLHVNATGLTTTAIPCDDRLFELALDFTAHRVTAVTSDGERWEMPLAGQSFGAFWGELHEVLVRMEVHPRAARPPLERAAKEGEYDREAIERFWRALSQLDILLKRFQSGLREETSPVQFWSHHMDLAMLWFSGRRVPGQDPANEELADEQMNFGFSPGDQKIPEPYLYATAYPYPAGLDAAPLPAPGRWQSEGFKATGALLPYAALVEAENPARLALEFWRDAHRAGSEKMK
jgi:hypothetical protein